MRSILLCEVIMDVISVLCKYVDGFVHTLWILWVNRNRPLNPHQEMIKMFPGIVWNCQVSVYRRLKKC